MAARNGDNDTGNRRSWHKGERSKVSIMHIFRSAHFEHDQRVSRGKTADGETEITQRSKQRREGMDEGSLKQHLQADLNALMNTIRLDSAVSLEDTPHVMHSVVNYGFRDLSNVTAQDLNSSAVVNSIRESLLDHEPRIIPQSLEVTVAERAGGNRNRLSISVTAELMGDPVDVPIDFDAEVDLGAGKLHMSGLRMQT